MKKENYPEFTKFMNAQFEILKGHHERIMLRIFNKYAEIETKEREDS